MAEEDNNKDASGCTSGVGGGAGSGGSSGSGVPVAAEPAAPAAHVSSDDNKNNDHENKDDSNHPESEHDHEDHEEEEEEHDDELEEPHHHHHHHHKRRHHHPHHQHHHHHHHKHHEKGEKAVPSKDSLWHDALEIKLSDTDLLQITGLTSPERTVFARVVYVRDSEAGDDKKDEEKDDGEEKKLPEEQQGQEEGEGKDKTEDEKEAVTSTTTTTTGKATATIRDVVDRVVTESWRHLAREIMEKKNKKNKAESSSSESAANDEDKDDDDGDGKKPKRVQVVSSANSSTSTTGSTVDTYPSAQKLFELGAVWLLDETRYVHGGDAHAHRVLIDPPPQQQQQQQQVDAKNDENNNEAGGDKEAAEEATKDDDSKDAKDDPTLQVPNWEDMTLRIYLSPERFFVSHEYDWTKYARGRLVGGEISVQINDGNKPHPVPFDGYPDDKDGVIVYEDTEHHFLVINKPGCVPVHPTRANHAEDVISMISNALQERRNHNHSDGGENKKKHHEQEKKLHAIVPQRLTETLDIATHGLLAVGSDPAFAAYYNHLFDNKKKKKKKTKNKDCSSKGDDDEEDAPKQQQKQVMTRSYKCLVGVPDGDTIERLERLQSHQTTIVHYTDPKSPTPKRFVRNNPNNKGNHSKHHHHRHHHHHNHHHDDKHQWRECQLRIKKIGDTNFRAACVRSVYPDSVDSSLAHRLWGPEIESKSPAEDLGFQYVMELEVEVLNQFHLRDQIRGQLAALGCPIVGDEVYGGGKCELYSHHHVWNRMAIQCNELSFPEPMWEDENHDDGGCESSNKVKGEDHDDKNKKPNNNNNTKKKKQKQKKQLVPSERMCVFRLERAWWSEYIDQYEQYHTSY